MANTHPVIDLFCGAGGLSLGAARAGFDLRLAVDKESLFLNIHKKNFPNTPHLEADVSELSSSLILQKAQLKGRQLTGLIGGPPCQGFSVMGRREQTDSRNELFKHFFRLVAELKPKFFLAENVPGIEGSIFSTIREAAFDQVRKEYTILNPLTVDASKYGAPTTRTRVFYIGYQPRHFTPLTHETFVPAATTEAVNVKDALLGLPLKISPNWEKLGLGWRTVGQLTSKKAFAERLRGKIPSGIGDPTAIARLNEKREVAHCLGTRHSEEIIARYEGIEPGGIDSKLRAPRLKADGFCPTLRAGTGSDKGSYQAIRPIHYKENRVITPREAARLQGFPDWFVFHETKWHTFRVIGNSVSPLVAEKLLKIIFDRISTT